VALSATASNLIVIWYLVASILNIVALGLLAWGLVRLHTVLNQLSGRVEPLLNKTDTVLAQASEQIEKVGVSAGNILAHGESITSTLEEQTRKTSVQVSRVVYRPFIGINALLSAISEGTKTYKTLQKQEKQKGVKT
jgi:hypothetical protein